MITFNLESTSGRISALTETLIPPIFIGVFLAVYWQDTDAWGWGLAAVTLGLAYTAVMGASWLHTLELQRIDRSDRERLALLNSNPEIVSRRLKIEHVNAVTLAFERVAQLSPDQVQLALDVTQDAQFTISGNRVTWIVDGINVPPEFAQLWLDKWATADGDDLPRVNDWEHDCGYTREEYRRYTNAINKSLVTLGAAKYTGGPIPGRWIVPQTERLGFLQANGLTIAVSWVNVESEL